jgi:hypothetical protein
MLNTCVPRLPIRVHTARQYTSFNQRYDAPQRPSPRSELISLLKSIKEEGVGYAVKWCIDVLGRTDDDE